MAAPAPSPDRFPAVTQMFPYLRASATCGTEAGVMHRWFFALALLVACQAAPPVKPPPEVRHADLLPPTLRALVLDVLGAGAEAPTVLARD
jgi:hypothetical protein